MVAYIIDQEAFDALSDALKAEYKKRESDGKYVLDVQGAVPSEKLKEFRDANIQLKADLEKFTDVDPVKYKELLKIETDLRSGKVKDGKTVEEIVAERTEAMKLAFEKEKTTLTKQLEGTTGELTRLKIADAAVAVGAELGLRPTAREDLIGRVSQLFKLRDGKPVAIDPQGNEIYGAGAEPLTVKEYVSGLVEKAPHLFEPSNGGSAPGNRGNGAVNRNVNPWKKETFNVTKQGEIYKANPELARRMAQEAGTPLPA